MNTVDKLRKEVAEDPIFNAVIKVFAERERTRKQVTTNALYLRMEKEGFTYTRDQYGEVLRKLYNMGFGKLETNVKGRVKALKDIKITLQSIGQVALGNTATTKNFTERNKFGRLLTSESKVTKQLERSSRAPRAYQTVGAKLILTVLINGKPVNVPVPKELTTEEVAMLINKFQEPTIEPSNGKEVPLL